VSEVLPPLAIFCGAGALPIEAARAAQARGRRVFLVGFSGSAEREIEAFDHIWVKLGEVGKFLKAFQEREIVELAMLGAINRPEFSDLKLDWGAVQRAPGIARALRGGDDNLLRAIGRLFEAEGFRFVGLSEFAPELLAPAGPLAGPAPDAEAQADIDLGARLLASLSPFDVGQGAVVARGRVLAVEAAEGTDAMLARVAELRKSRRIRLDGRVGVFVKAAKRGQDFRFDLPTVGSRTLQAAERAGLAGVAVAAGQTVVAEREALIAAAQRAKLFVVGFAP